MQRQIAVLCGLAILTAGCGTTAQPGGWTPMIDQRNVDPARYEQDFTECKSYAETGGTVEEHGRRNAIRGGVAGGALAAGAIVATGGLAAIPLLGGVVATQMGIGALGGKFFADSRYRSVITQCLNGRGYSVIG
jgi:hypothetical protein